MLMRCSLLGTAPSLLAGRQCAPCVQPAPLRLAIIAKSSRGKKTPSKGSKSKRNRKKHGRSSREKDPDFSAGDMPVEMLAELNEKRAQMTRMAKLVPGGSHDLGIWVMQHAMGTATGPCGHRSQ
jgi:hypothetical protein